MKNSRGIIIIIIIIMHNLESVLENENHKILRGFEIQANSLIPCVNWKKKCYLVPVDHRLKIKESEKTEKYMDLARELKKLWNMKLKVLPIVIDALGTVLRSLMKEMMELEIRRKIGTIQTSTLQRSARILRRVLETRGDLVSLRLRWKTAS